MPVIRIPDPVFARLQAIAIPLVDTPESVVEKLLDFHEMRSKESSSSLQNLAPAHRPDAVIECHPDTPPDLTHTRGVAGRFDGESAENWNELVHVAHRCAFQKYRSFEALRSVTLSSIARGPRSDKGFHYLPDINISIQNVSANEAWSKLLHLARQLDAVVEVAFEWREKAGAAHPGKNGRLVWTPKNH